MKIILIVGARPNFMKIAPLMKLLKINKTIKPILVHTGQHYDEKMSNLFFKQLDIPEPDVNLGVGSASHAVQTARIIEKFEVVCIDKKPDCIFVVGDVNSTVACTLVASKLGIKTIHYEAGLRSNDKTMPEEINRLLTDSISDLLLTTSYDADDNLLKEGKSKNNIFMLGNLMIDTLYQFINKIDLDDVFFNDIINENELSFKQRYIKKEYGIVTFHRPSNVDGKEILSELTATLCEISNKIPIIFPVHPRTYRNILSYSLLDRIKASPNIFLCSPVGYLEFIKIVESSKFVLTDSGGIQEETTVLGVPCLTVRPNTERPITIWEGTNKLISVNEIEIEILKILNGESKKGSIPKFWDGNTAKRIVEVLENTKIVSL